MFSLENKFTNAKTIYIKKKEYIFEPFRKHMYILENKFTKAQTNLQHVEQYYQS